AAVLGKGGEVFMLDMGEPVRIQDLARDLIELSGLVPGEDIEIQFTGIRPGEKLYEDLTLTSEQYSPTIHPKIHVLRDGQSVRPGRDWLDKHIEQMLASAEEMEPQHITEHLRILVPEYTPAAQVSSD
ncbi:MAG: polysaccharide biosynthesis protein, partial [Armatimonadota bacterium]|nr:polysaccharide biosynthesis protein [Armatimonadota bacterium]